MPAFLFPLVSWRKERIERKKEKSYTSRLLEKLFVKEAYMSAVAVENGALIISPQTRITTATENIPFVINNGTLWSR